MFADVHVWKCAHGCECVYQKCVDIHVCKKIGMYGNIQIFRTFMCMFTCKHIYTDVYVYVHKFIQKCTHDSRRSSNNELSSCKTINEDTYKTFSNFFAKCIHVYKHVYKHKYMHTHTEVYSYIYVYVYGF